MAALIYNIGTQNLYGNGFIWTIYPVNRRIYRVVQKVIPQF